MGRFQQGRGAARGRGHRYGNNNKNRKPTMNNNGPKKGLQDHIYSLGKQTIDYDSITKF